MRNSVLNALPPSHPWREGLQVYDVLDSTNRLAITLARQGAPEGTVILARQQTAGRGRMGRSFHSPMDSGLYMSVVLRPDCLPLQLMHLTCATAVAVCDSLEGLTGIRPDIKWINDLVINRRKIGGILTQLGFADTGSVEYAIIGIGINLTQKLHNFPEDLQDIAGSLQMYMETPPSLPRLAAAVMVALEQMSRVLLTDPEVIMEKYRQNCITLGSSVRVISPTDCREGRALTVLNDGSLRVEFTDGHQETVSSGEVSVRGLWDYL